MAHHVDDIRTVALVGHEVAGKTSLADALLFKAKAVERRGSPEDGTSVSDFDEEEKKHKYSIDSSVLHLDYHGKRVYLIDTPGKPDFVGQALGGINAVDTAILVISAAAGMQVNTRRMFKEAGKRGLARMIVINKLDADNIHFDELLKTSATPSAKPASCATRRSMLAPIQRRRQRARRRLATIPRRFARSIPRPSGPCSSTRSSKSDEALMEKYLEQGDLSARRVDRRLAKGARGRHRDPDPLHRGQEGQGPRRRRNCSTPSSRTRRRRRPPTNTTASRTRPTMSSSSRARPANSSPRCSRRFPTSSSAP